MKKSYFIFPLLFCFLSLFLPQTKAPVLADEEAPTPPAYEIIEITTELDNKDLVSLHTDGQSLFFTNGKKIVSKNLSSQDELLMFSRTEGNDYYSLFANDENLYFAQDNSKAYFIDKTKFSQQYTSIDNYNYKTENANQQIENHQVGILNSIKNITADAQNNAYIIFENYIGHVSKHTIGTESTTYELDQTIYPLPTTQVYSGGGFTVSEDGTEFYYSVGSKIYKITTEETEPQEISGVNFTNNIRNLSVDSLGNLFVLTKSIELVDSTIQTKDVLWKLTPNGNSYTGESIVFDFDIEDITYDFCSGKAYAIIKVNEAIPQEQDENPDENIDEPTLDEDEPQDSPSQDTQEEPQMHTVTKIVDLNTYGLVTNYALLEAENYEIFSTSQASTEIIELINIPADTPMYAYQSLKTAKVSTNEVKAVVKLADSNKFYYILDTNYTLSPYFRLAYVPKRFIAETDIVKPRILSNTESKVIVAKIKLYNYPLSVIQKQVDKEITYAPYSNIIPRDSQITVCKLNTKLPLDSNNTPFYLVKFTKDEQNYFAYIDSRTIISLADDNSLKMIPVSNATLRQNATIYNDEKLSTQQDELVEGANVTVLHKSGGVAKIQYYIGNELKTGYVDKNLVDDGSLTTMQLIGLGVASTCVVLSIIFAIIIAKSRKKHR